MQPVRIEVLGQSCMAIRSGEHELVTDPWFSGPAYLGGWRAYPELDGTALERMRARIDRATHVYVSRDHGAHFDPAFLATLAPKTLVVGEFRNARFRRQLQALCAGPRGHTLRVLGASELLELDGRAQVRVVPEQPLQRTQSLLALQTPFGSVLDACDCALDSPALRALTERTRVRVMLYTLGFLSGGDAVPYLRRDQPNLRAQLDALREQAVAGFRGALRMLQPDLGLAFGGPAAFAHSVNEHFNAHPEALDWSAMVSRVDGESCVLWPGPGSVFELGDEGVAPVELLDYDTLLHEGPRPTPSSAFESEGQVPSETELEAIAAKFTARLCAVLDAAGARAGVPLYLCAVPSLSALESRDYTLCLRIELDAPQRGARRVDPVMPRPPYLQITSTRVILRGFMRGEIALDELLRSAHARFARDPDALSPTLLGVLRHGHDEEGSAALIESWRSKRSDPPPVAQKAS